MTTFERVTYRPHGDKRKSTLILQNPTEGTFLGAQVLKGVEVDIHADEIAPKGIDERQHIIETALIVRRIPLVMDNNYGWLVEKP